MPGTTTSPPIVVPVQPTAGLRLLVRIEQGPDGVRCPRETCSALVAIPAPGEMPGLIPVCACCGTQL
jgi:hypothetical protein